MTIVYQDLPVFHGTGEILKDSKTDWRVLKLKTVAVSKSFDQPQKYWLGWSQRMFDCGQRLIMTPHGNKQLRALFCRDRCTVVRRSMAIFTKLNESVSSSKRAPYFEIFNAHPYRTKRKRRAPCRRNKTHDR